MTTPQALASFAALRPDRERQWLIRHAKAVQRVPFLRLLLKRVRKVCRCTPERKAT